MTHHHHKHRHRYWLFFGLSFLIALLLLLGASWLVAQNTGKSQAVTGTSPQSTSDKTVKMLTDSTPTQITPSATVADTGNPTWVQIKSKDKLTHFTEMSTSDLTIYRANNPKILKTATKPFSPLIRMNTVMAQYPGTLIMNGSAFNMSTGQIVGLQINNGKIFHDWDNIRYSFIINSNGTCQIYDSTTPASEIVKNGAAMSFDFGTALIIDGKTLPNTGAVNWEMHSFIGNDKNNNLYMIISVTNAGYQNIMKQVANLHLVNLLELDSGGSSQLSLKGKIIFPSQDNRAVPDYIVLK